VTLAGATAVVTGASRGIGRAIAEALVDAGSRVIGLSRTGQGPRGVTSVAVDLLDPPSLQRAITSCQTACQGAPDILVNNAGAFVVAPIAETSPELFERVIALNLSVPFRLIHAFLPGMQARRSGHIVSIGSVADHVGFPGNGAYGGSKFGLRGLHEVLRVELAGSGVRATLVAPGAVRTALWDELAPATRATLPPAEMMLDAADIAEAVVYAVTRRPTVGVDEVRLSYA